MALTIFKRLGRLGFGEDKLPETFEDNHIGSAYAPLDGINERELTVTVLRIGDEPTNPGYGKKSISRAHHGAIRLMLDKTTMWRALALLGSMICILQQAAIYHFQISDARGKSVVG